MLIPIAIAKSQEERLKAAFVKQAMIDVPGLRRDQAEAAFDKIHKNRALWPDFRQQPVSKASMVDLVAKARAQVAEMKKVLGR